MKKFQIVVDSSSDILSNHFNDDDVLLNIAPLSINVGEKEFVDDENLDIVEMLDAMHNYNDKSTSSCPSPGTFAEYFKQAEYTFCITMTSALSGTFNSANLAASTVAEAGHKVHIIDSKLTAGILVLLADECYRLIKSGLSFEEIVPLIDDFNSKKDMLFVLDSFENLIKNGRMSRISGIIAGLLSIKPIACGLNGEIKVIEKKRTATQALKRAVELIGERVSDFSARDLIISHCFNLEVAEKIKQNIESLFDFRSIRIIPMRGLCSFYSLEKGIIISY